MLVSRQTRYNTGLDMSFIPSLAAKDFAHHWFKMFKVRHGIIGVKRGLIPPLTKIRAALPIGIVAEFVALVRVPAIVMAVIFHLEDTVLFNNPGYFFADKGADYLGSHAVVILWRKTISDIMDQGSNDPVDISPVIFQHVPPIAGRVQGG